MGEFMTVEACRSTQTGCSKDLNAKIERVAASAQRTEVIVAGIAGHFGLKINGGVTAVGSGPIGQYTHHRAEDPEEDERRHQRTIDAVVAAINAQPRGLPMPPRWFVVAGMAAFVMAGMAILYLMLTGLNHEAISDLGKIHQAAPK